MGKTKEKEKKKKNIQEGIPNKARDPAAGYRGFNTSTAFRSERG